MFWQILWMGIVIGGSWIVLGMVALGTQYGSRAKRREIHGFESHHLGLTWIQKVFWHRHEWFVILAGPVSLVWILVIHTRLCFCRRSHLGFVLWLPKGLR